jgi:hypothetical protein
MYVWVFLIANHSHSHVNLSLFPGDFFIAAFQCPHRVERIGTLGDGGKWMCGVDRIAKQEKCVIYSFGLSFLPPPHCLHRPRVNPHTLCILTGVNRESSFEADLMKRAPGCEAWGYDYSVDSVRVPCPFFYRGTPPQTYLSLTSGDPRSKMTLSLIVALTSKPWRLVGPTTTRSSPVGGHLIRS